MTHALVKEQAHRLVDKLPDSAAWDDLIREIYVRQVIERGLANSNARRTKDVRQIRKKHGLPE